MTDKEIASAKHGTVLHFPTVLGAVVITYNLPGCHDATAAHGRRDRRHLHGPITKWNDARLTALNPGV